MHLVIQVRKLGALFSSFLSLSTWDPSNPFDSILSMTLYSIHFLPSPWPVFQSQLLASMKRLSGCCLSHILWPEAGEFSWLSPWFGYLMEFCCFKVMNYSVHSNPLVSSKEIQKKGLVTQRSPSPGPGKQLVQHSRITEHLLITYCVYSMHCLDASSHLIPIAPFVK